MSVRRFSLAFQQRFVPLLRSIAYVVARSKSGAPKIARFWMKSTPRFGPYFSPVPVLLGRSE